MEKNHTYIIAEAGVNHNGSLDMAKRLVEVAAEAGVDAIKFQTFNAQALVSPLALKADYQARVTDPNESQFEMIRKLELDERAHEALMEQCKLCGIEFLSTPFDLASVDFLVKQLEVPCVKISSGDITNAPLLLRIARSGKTVILSTGMSTLGEIEDALGVLAFGYSGKSDPSAAAFRAAYCAADGRDALLEKVVLLHCTTEYPAPFEEVNLKVMDTLMSAFGLPVGYSDHTDGIAVSIAAVARGAVVIEKHLTLDRSLPGPDHRASLEPAALREMVAAVRSVERALGSGIKMPTPSELKNKAVARKSVVAAGEIKTGELLTESNLTVKRPGHGLSPMFYWDLLGKQAPRNFAVDEEVMS